MALTLILGPANSAKAGEVLAAYDAATARGALLVVPTAADAEHYSRELAGQGSVLGSVITFSALAGEVARRAGYAGSGLSSLQRERVLRRVIASTRLQTLSRSADTPGFVLAAGDLIAELQRSLITPQRFASALESWGSADRRRTAYARDLASLYLAYARELDRLGRVDRELYAWRALDALRTEPGSWGEAPVFFYGFDDFHAIERDAIETLSRIVGVEVTVSLTYEPRREALSARAEVVQELRALAGRVKELPALDQHYAPDSRQALHRLERSLFEAPPAPIDPGQAVRLLEAGGERAEAELVAAEILELLREGAAGDEIVVICRSLARSAPVFERVFRRYGLPFASEHRIPFSHTALGHSVLALARCALLDGGASAQDLLDYLRAPGLLEHVGVADRLEASVRREGLRTAAQARERLGWGLSEIDALREARDLSAELARQARRLFAAPHRRSARILCAEEEVDARALAALLRALAELEEIGERISERELIELLEALELPAASFTARTGSIALAEPLSIRARRFKAVFVCGCNEGEFPQPAAGEPFLSDERRRELALTAGLALPAREDALARERYLFYACISRPSERLVLSYRSSDEEGNLALPSPFISDVGELFVPEWAQRRRRRLLADVVWSAQEAPTERELARSLAQSKGAPALNEPARVLGDPALRHLRHREVVSAGALESYADCPVKWLIERQLSPDRFAPEPDPITRGSYMHSVLEQLLSRLGGSVTESSLAAANRILDDLLAEMPGGLAPGRTPAVRAAALRSIEADLRRYLAHEAADGCGWKPQGLELRFGFEDDEPSLPPVSFDDGSTTVRLRGVIDRVDVDAADGTRAIVRDYKSGRSRPEHQGARWQLDRRLQVALYMLAVRDLLGLEPIAGFYQPLGGRDLRARGVYLKGTPVGNRLLSTDCREQDALEEVLADAAKRALGLARRLQSGELTPCPETCSRDGCSFPGICRSV